MLTDVQSTNCYPVAHATGNADYKVTANANGYQSKTVGYPTHPIYVRANLPTYERIDLSPLSKEACFDTRGALICERCSEGEVTNTCFCGNTYSSGGYCCANTLQTTPCTTTPSTTTTPTVLTVELHVYDARARIATGNIIPYIISQARVEVYTREDVYLGVVNTNEYGGIRGDAPIGIYKVKISKEGYRTTEQTIEISNRLGAPSNFNIYLERTT